MKLPHLLTLSVLLPHIILAAPELPGTPATAGKEPATQAEKDWVDSRWQQMDIGSFLASNLHTPAGWVAKGLSIRVGDAGEASVCYDTGTPALRAAWTGGFLTFSPARFGLGGPPTAGGDWAFSTPAGMGWRGATVRHEALHVHGQRVVIDTRVGPTLVRETPWFEKVGELNVFTRTLEIDASTAALTHRLFLLPGASGTVHEEKNLGLAILEKNGIVTAVARQGGTKVGLTVNDGAVEFTIPAHSPGQHFKLLLWTGPRARLPEFEKHAAIQSAFGDLRALSKPGAARWLPALTNAGQVGFPTDGFAVDTLTAPYNNPWKALLFCAGVDFFRDGSAAIGTIHGDVWRVSGLDDKLQAVTWKRFATGLFQPLGLRVVNDRVHVLGRDQITVLHDDNGDGEADRYENFCNLMETSTGGHDYTTCLDQDAAGNFYYVDPIGVHRISADGRTTEILATGFRNPNGLGVSRTGIITVTPQQGTWTPSSVIHETKRGGYYGYGGPRITPERPLGYDAPLCWLPHAFDNSSSSQTWVPANRWGALGGQMLHFAWGRCTLMLVLRDVTDGLAQGAAVALPVKFLSGPMRGTFNPHDGNLYVAGSTGWQTSAARDGCLQRVRYTGKPLRVPVAWRAHENGIALTFAQPLDRAAAEDAGRYAVHQWNYLYSANYGSKDYSVANPQQEGRDEVEVRTAKLQADGRTVFLELPGLRPVMQMELKYNLPFAGGGTASSPLYLTLNRLGKPLH